VQSIAPEPSLRRVILSLPRLHVSPGTSFGTSPQVSDGRRALPLFPHSAITLLGKGEIAVDHEHLGAGTGQQDSRRAAVADAIARGAPAADNRDLVGKPRVILRTVPVASWSGSPERPVVKWSG
jgi:hypothetical protein